MKCVAYCRVSTDKDEQLNSLENQIRHYTELFKKEGYEGAECGMYYSREGRKEKIKYIKSIFADEGISGTKLKNREAFKYMLECAYRKEFDVIYVKNIQRWARSVEDGAGILKKLKVMGIKVIFEDGNLNNFDHEVTINILLSMAQEESRAKSVAVQFGIRKAQEDGKFISALPYGYTSENGYLKIIPEQAEIVRQIFDLYINKGWGSIKISRYLNQRGIPTQKGKKWTQTQILNIINNDIYAGIQTTHTVVNTDINIDAIEHTDQKSQKTYKFRSRKKVDPSEWIMHYIEDIKIISDEMYNKVKEERERRKEMCNSKIRKSTKHVFSNLLYCAYCGRALRRKKLCTWIRKDGTRKLKYEWVCTNYDRSHTDICKFRNSWEENKLLEEIKSKIKEVQNNTTILDTLFQKYMETFLSSEDVSEQIHKIESKIEDIKAESEALLRMVAKKYITDEQFKEHNDKLVNERKEYEQQLVKLNQIEDARTMAKKQYERYIQELTNFDIDTLGTDPTQSNLFLRSIINKIVCIDKGDGEKQLKIIWNMLDKSEYQIKEKQIPIS